MTTSRNVLGGPLLACSYAPLTGFYRTGCCETGVDDLGRHLVCIRATTEFLAFSRSVGNDLSTPRPEFRFGGLKPGDRWCLCVLRWKEALAAGVAPPVVLEATHSAALRVVELETLKAHAVVSPARGLAGPRPPRRTRGERKPAVEGAFAPLGAVSRRL